MPFKKLQLKPGVDIEQSPTLNAFQISTSNLIRFYAGLVQCLGGWTQKTAQTFTGVCRGLHGWADIYGNPYLAIGTDQRLQVLIAGSIADITPIVQTDNPAVAFSTTIGSPLVLITDASYQPTAGDTINLQTQVSVGGLLLFGYYLVQSVSDATHYTIMAASNAISTVTNGGAVPAYTTANTSSTVSVALANHGLITGGLFNAVVSTTVATVVISGLYPVTFVDSGHFTISTTVANATTTASENGGNARIQYLLPSGTPLATAASGYGIGDYGDGDYGGSTAGGQVIKPARQWSLDHFGQDLIASPNNGKIYYWMPPTTVGNPAAVVSGSAPLNSVAVFVMPQAEIIVSLGAETGGTQEPLLIRWCDLGDFTDWTATATNQAGSYVIPTGSTLVGGLATGLGATIWTDVDVWSMTYIGFPLVFGFNRVAPNAGLIAQRAAGTTSTFVMWLSTHQFWQDSIGGGVLPVECSVWDFYFYNVDFTQLPQIFCAVNSVFNEMAWHFPLATSSPLYNPLAPTGYVKYNYVEKVWDFGLSPQYQYTAWVDHSPAGLPIGADTSFLLQEHEIGTNANGQAILWSWQTGYFDLHDGEDYVYSDMLIPDWVVLPETASAMMVPNIQTQNYPFDPPVQVSVPAFTNATEFVPYSARGRQMSFGFAGGASDVNSFTRLGGVRIRYAIDGRN